MYPAQKRVRPTRRCQTHQCLTKEQTNPEEQSPNRYHLGKQASQCAPRDQVSAALREDGRHLAVPHLLPLGRVQLSQVLGFLLTRRKHKEDMPSQSPQSQPCAVKHGDLPRYNQYPEDRILLSAQERLEGSQHDYEPTTNETYLGLNPFRRIGTNHRRKTNRLSRKAHDLTSKADLLDRRRKCLNSNVDTSLSTMQAEHSRQ